jgi:hypothetical protein
MTNQLAQFSPYQMVILTSNQIENRGVVGDICEALTKIGPLFLVAAFDFSYLGKMSLSHGTTLGNSRLPHEVSGWFSRDYFGHCRVGRLIPLIID